MDSKTGLILLWDLLALAGFMLSIHVPALVIKCAPHLSGSLGLGCRKQILYLPLRKRNTLCSDMILHKLLSRNQYKWTFSFIFLNTFIIINQNAYCVLDTGESAASEQGYIGPCSHGAYSLFGETNTKQILFS